MPLQYSPKILTASVEAVIIYLQEKFTEMYDRTISKEANDMRTAEIRRIQAGEGVGKTAVRTEAVIDLEMMDGSVAASPEMAEAIKTAWQDPYA